ncbi:MAG: NUDIX domain-containing protein [Deltaproteobacteria bacterium]|nr:NUDIX domain-containing protein [Deltaproteobacteria bacterium]
MTQRTRFVSEVPKGTQVRVGVGVLVLDDRNRVLLERRSDCGLWGLLGGQVEAGESVLAATIREVKEESGLDVRILGLLGVYSEPSEGRVAIYPDNTVQLVDIVFTAAITAGQLSISAESDELRFFDGDQLPANLVPPARQPLMDFVGGRSGVVR